MNMYTCGLCGALLLQLCLVQVHGDTIYCIHMYTIVLYTVMVCDCCVLCMIMSAMLMSVHSLRDFY